MSNLTCVNAKKAEQICINENCRAECSYICLNEDDVCHGEHSGCSFVSLSYLGRKSRQINNKAFDFKMQNLLNLYKQSKKTLQWIDTFLSQYSMLSIIKNIINQQGTIDSGNKVIIAEFMKSNLKEQPWVHPEQLQLKLAGLQAYIDQYLVALRQSLGNRKDNSQSSLKKSQIRSKKVLSSPIKSVSNQYKSTLNLLSEKLHVRPQPIQSNVKQEILPSKSSKITNSIKRFLPKAPFFSQITDQLQGINTFFYHKIVEAKLLYRASENEYLVSRFHEKCDGIPNTLVLVLNDCQKIIGGFTPLPWSSKGQWHADTSKQTFLFSLTEHQRYPLINKDKAIWCSKSFGPSFGYPDLQISDKSLYNKKSCANFPQCFNNSNYKLCPDSLRFFCGTTTGYFKILQWEVYQLIF